MLNVKLSGELLAGKHLCRIGDETNMGFVLMFLLIYFIVRLIGIYKKDIWHFFNKFAKRILTWSRSKRIKSLLTELEALGFYKHADNQLVEELKKRSNKTGYLFWNETQRMYKSDAEDLAEGFIGQFFKEIAPFLIKEGITIESYEQSHTGDTYEIIVNHKRFLILDDKIDNHLVLWELATNRTFSVVNLLLHEAGSNERLYSLYGGNDLFAIFLTKKMYETIRKSKLIKKTEKPVWRG
ncbi:hypothetical protein V7149_13015 [Bacillus sp. JJ1503]|uniref:hypothetical protein n=1 Tax=unclassified Bacillus (in: firmicutes) TaxID=185979 RepID=UPI002FFF5F95